MKEIRDEIIAKIATKKGSAEKLQIKADSLKTQREMYLAAIEEYKEKIAKLEALVEQRGENAEGYDGDVGVRTNESVHMQEILDRYDKANVERAVTVKKIQDRIDELPVWMPGMDDKYKDGNRRDPKVRKLTERRDYLDRVIEAALPDVKKIFYSRGTVATFNEKGRKGV